MLTMKGVVIYIRTIVLCSAIFLHCNTIFSQRILGDLETNTNQDMIPDEFNYDETDSTENKKEKIVPVDIHAWTIDNIFGERTILPIDTTLDVIAHKSQTEGLHGQYNNLANLGSPRLNRIYMERKDDENFIFRTPFDFFLKSPNEIIYYNTKSPYVNLFYDKGGDKTTGFDHFKAIYTVNAGKHFNFGALYDYMYGQGYYSNQSTAFQNATAWASYINDKYDLHFSYNHNYMKMAENGGITDEGYITNPDTFPRTSRAQDIPVWLNQNWMRQESDIIHLNHRYSMGFYNTEDTDSVTTHDVFVPVMSVFHTLDFSHDSHKFIEYETPNEYHTHTYFNDDDMSTTRSSYFKNIIGLSLREGFNKWAKAGLNIYAGLENKNYTIRMDSTGVFRHQSYKENNFLLGAQIIKEQGRTIHYNIMGEFVAVGDNIGDFKLIGQGDLNLSLNMPKLGFHNDTIQFAISAFIKTTDPNIFFCHYHSRHAWWDNNNLDKTVRMRIAGSFSLPRTRTRLDIGLETLKNYTYLFNNGKQVTGTNTWSNEVSVGQESKLIQIISATLRQDFVYGILHFDNDFTLQATTDEDVLPLPTLSTYHNLYLQFNVVKNVLKAQLGADMTYFSEYYAPNYSPVVSQFMVQNTNNREKIGNYPLISAYLSIDLKQLRAYIKYYHANQGQGRYFWAPGYPMNPGGIQFGVSWNFYD